MQPIYVFVRHCILSENSKHKPRPDWFTKERAFRNLINLIDENVHVTVLLDTATIEDPSSYFTYKYNSPNIETICMKGGSDAHSFINLLNHICSQTNIPDNAIIYLLEDDYVHQVGWAKILREGFALYIADYITLYDHSDKYNQTVYPNLTTKLYTTKSCHWRSTPSTTNTYALLFKTLKKQKDIHLKFSSIKDGYTYDHDKFMHLMVQGYTLISSIPGYSTHVEEKHLSPTVDWETVL